MDLFLKCITKAKRLLFFRKESSFLKSKKGMTLMEILIVLAILGGLAATLYPMVMGRMKNAQVKQAKLTMSQIIQAVNSYNADCGRYPKSLESLSKADPECSNWGPDPYMKKIPKDPWNTEFTYELNGANFIIKTTGADRKEGGDGVNKDLSSEDLE